MRASPACSPRLGAGDDAADPAVAGRGAALLARRAGRTRGRVEVRPGVIPGQIPERRLGASCSTSGASRRRDWDSVRATAAPYQSGQDPPVPHRVKVEASHDRISGRSESWSIWNSGRANCRRPRPRASGPRGAGRPPRGETHEPRGVAGARRIGRDPALIVVVRP